MHRNLSQLLSKILSDANIKEFTVGGSLAFIRTILGHISMYFFFVVVGRTFGADSLGVFSLTISILYITSNLANLGFSTTIIKYLGEISGNNRSGYILLYKKVIGVTLACSLFLAALLYSLAGTVASYLFSSLDYSSTIRLLSLCLPIIVLLQINTEFIRGCKQIGKSEFLRKSSIWLFAITLVLLCTGKGQLTVVGSYLIANILSCLISIYWIYTALQKNEQENKANAKSYFSIKQLIYTAFPMLVSGISYTIMEHTDKIMLGALGDIENVGVYEIALKLSFLVCFMINVIGAIFAPKLAEAYSNKNTTLIYTMFRLSSWILLGIGLITALLLSIFPNFFLGLFGSEFVTGKTTLYILIIGQLGNAIGGMNGIYLNITGGEKTLTKIAISTTIINILLNYFLIGKFGGEGAALATTISLFFRNTRAIIAIYKRDQINLLSFFLPSKN